jgi:hypothetical protein
MAVVETFRSILVEDKLSISVKFFTQNSYGGVHGNDVRTPTPEGNLS